MTVGAVIVPSSVADAVADAAGRAAVRRMVDAAWAGGAMPIIVVSPDPEAVVADALDGSPAVLVEADPSPELGAYRTGTDAAAAAVLETTAVLLWPGRMVWVDPETVTSLIEAHGAEPGRITRPRRAGETGWPVLLPIEAGDSLLAEPDGSLAEALATADIAIVELGDPGSVLGSEVGIDDLPEYDGPPEPLGGPPPEWGAAAADHRERGLDDD